MATLSVRRYAKATALAATLALLNGTSFAADPTPCTDCVPERIAHCGGFLEGPNFDADGLLWVVDYRTGNILTVKDGVCRVAASTGGAANGARFGPDGRLYVADAKRGLLIFDPKRKTLTTWIDRLEGAPLLGANDLAFDGEGDLYVTVRGTATYLDASGRVILIPKGSSEPQVLARNLRFPNGIAVNRAGTQLFVGLFSEKTILAINLDPATRAPQLSYVYAHTEGGIGPDGMMLDGDGRLLWADFGGGTVTIADAAARIQGRIRLPAEAGQRVTNITRHGDAFYLTEADKGEIWRVPARRETR